MDDVLLSIPTVAQDRRAGIVTISVSELEAALQRARLEGRKESVRMLAYVYGEHEGNMMRMIVNG